MGDGMTQSRREERAADRVIVASDKLADALLDLRDAAFGYTALTLEIVNDALMRAGVKVILL